jgi:predicted nucleic acid-binding OB-fold protein
MSLKYHAFQLLPGIGNSKALQMVQLRGISGWSDFAAVDEACGIDSARLLAERYVMEMEDDAQTPRLLDILVRSEM